MTEPSKDQVLQDIEKEVKSHKILIYVKGTKEQPQCGFSAATIQLFNGLGHPFDTIDILANPDRRAIVPDYSQWPTFPQVFVNGKFVGGCDIVHEMHEQGELKAVVDAAFK
jgi:monothiol glutaredoxin